MPTNKNTRKLSPSHDVVHNEKRRKIKDDNNDDDDTLNPPKIDVEIVTPVGKHKLEILNTPLVKKTINSPSITNCSSILKVNVLCHN